MITPGFRQYGNNGESVKLPDSRLLVRVESHLLETRKYQGVFQD